MAHKEKKHEYGDIEVGLVWCRSELQVLRSVFREKLILLLKQTVKFINDEASSIHGAIRVASIYTSESGEWKVGGFEVLSSTKDDEAIIYVGTCSVLKLLCY